jgi:mutator protein MutT
MGMFKCCLFFAAVSLAAHEVDVFLEREFQGDCRKGEIEIVKDPQKIVQIEETQVKRLLKKGLTEEAARASARTGIVAEDIYWIWLRDPVLFPGGAMGTYDRLLWKSALNGPAGVAVLPILPDGKIALNLNFRHATRSWEFELPRGSRGGGETSEEAARRELKEETGFEVQKFCYLGEMAPDSGALSSVVPIYAGQVGKAGAVDREESEAIAAVHAYSIEEIEEGLRKGYIETTGHGKVPVRDSFLTYALYQWKNQREGKDRMEQAPQASPERPKIGVGVLVLQNGSVLIGKRHGSHGSGTWGLPGGHLEFGETPEECAARELFEETGLKALSIRPTKHYVTLFMVVDQFEGTVETKEPHKCEKWEWTAWDRLPEPLFAPLSSLKSSLKQNEGSSPFFVTRKN